MNNTAVLYEETCPLCGFAFLKAIPAAALREIESGNPCWAWVHTCPKCVDTEASITEQKNSIMDNTLSQYSQAVGISEEDLLGRSRKQELCVARQSHWLVMHRMRVPYDEISRLYGRDRGTIILGIRHVANLIETRDKLVEPYLAAIERFSSQGQHD